MSNKRQLKKHIAYACGEMAAECVIAATFNPQADKEKLDDCIYQIALLQRNSLARTNVSFDKAPRDFADAHAYRKARSQYYGKAFKALADDFNVKVAEIVAEMNKALPKAAK